MANVVNAGNFFVWRCKRLQLLANAKGAGKAMHIPDGFLNAAAMGTTYVISFGGLANAIRVARDKIGEKHIPMMGILAAFVFVAQMINFPVAGGTSGHVIGTALVAILLGPWAAVIIMSVVLNRVMSEKIIVYLIDCISKIRMGFIMMGFNKKSVLSIFK